jgi:type VI secretion system protein ImpF
MARAEHDRPIQQSILDRLTQDRLTQDRLTAAVASETGRRDSVRQLKAAVRRDLEWLLNTRSPALKLPDWAVETRRSAFNYGLPDLTSLSGDSPDDRVKLMRMIEAAVNAFEPRLANVEVSELPAKEGARQVRFEVRGFLRIDPAPELVSFDTLLDLGSQTYAVKAEG